MRHNAAYIPKLGIPYMGSKRKLAKRFLDKILEMYPNTKYIFDLFGGGGAFTFEAMQRKQIKSVYYNELSTQIVELMLHTNKHSKLYISNLSFKDVKITTPINETVIYLDPPYINTGEYKIKFEHSQLYDYIRHSPYAIFVSSYQYPLLDVVDVADKRGSFSATNNSLTTYERLFCNKKNMQQDKKIIYMPKLFDFVYSYAY